MEERDKANLELHGVVSDQFTTKEVDPLLKKEALQYFDECLDICKFDPYLPTEAYRLAESLSPEYVQRTDLRIKFLALVEYKDVKAAAERFIRYFDFKSKMFGPSRLCKDITFDDLPVEDQKAFKKGYIQVSPHRDRGDRVVVAFFTNMEDYDSLEQLKRVMVLT
ncbi:MAG: hypothetical protein SGARI_003177 [Bacillariaceae sp.]